MNTIDFDRTAASARYRPAPMSTCLLALFGIGHAGPALAQTPTSATTAAEVAAAAEVSTPEALNHRHAEALQVYERNHWPQAFSAFLVLANQGHAESARVVLLMHRRGPGLYGRDFALTASQRAFLVPLSTGSQRVNLLPVD